MMWTSTKRVIKSGFVAFWRNGFVSLASVLVMTVTLFVMGSLLFLGAVLDSSLALIRDKVDVNVYFTTNAPEGDIFTLQRQLEGLPEVAQVTYTSREKALEDFRARHENDQLTLQALDELSENPLGASLSVKAKETSQYENIANFLQSAQRSGGSASVIEKINFFQNKAAIDKLTQITEATRQFGLIFVITLIVASVLITFNTIRLAIYTAREEIAVMRLVGASNWYIRGPFLVEGVMYGVVSAVVTLLLFYPLTLALGPTTERFFGNINIFSYYVNSFAQIFLIILASGIVLGAVSSYLAVKRYLKV